MSHGTNLERFSTGVVTSRFQTAPEILGCLRLVSDPEVEKRTTEEVESVEKSVYLGRDEIPLRRPGRRPGKDPVPGHRPYE